MDELASQQLGNFSLRLFSSARRDKQSPMPYIKLEWGADFHQQENRMLEGDNVPVLTTTSAHLTRQLLETTGGCAFLPSQWEKEYPQLLAAAEIPPIVRPLYAVWLQNSDQQPLIRQLLKIPLNTAA